MTKVTNDSVILNNHQIDSYYVNKKKASVLEAFSLLKSR